ncbi:bifunctional glutamate--cysteine ligase GshA/glutathione synthetase GshB [Clostridium tarantellae]|uniref:Glutathione biosynthesis bifunctional protein GshAB n=1 Tax=Clostridium tarantellae TaxID=39493 RepID=A0A6I1MRD1_9CLOT|nr:bifunctional glutamate--cysteine ligase GshA/glutathione synthetase GshB [Clostridium tarantellae]MPQ43441.1 bifunctional glutamate--cysteine ligase GshA/glutathione synthetase GshB [Clostridium tarantellae]
MLYKIKDKINVNEYIGGKYGLEREALRVDINGKLSLKKHPKIFGDKISNPYITTDFSESQIELITPPVKTIEELYNFSSTLYDIVALNIGNEYLWPQSMPCNIPEDNEIPIAEFCQCSEKGKKAREYREKLFKKYGGKKQLISGIHFNFSFSEYLIEKLYENIEENISYKEFKNNIYLKVARNYLRYRWLLIYLLGGAAVIHKSYENKCVKKLEKIFDETFGNDEVLSYRNSECGYRNKVELFPCYKSLNDYIKSLKKFIEDGLIENHKELYSQIRLKPKDKEKFFDSLEKEGIDYLEIRSIDINPFDKVGISLEDLKFIQVFILFLLQEDEFSYSNWQEEAFYNQKAIAEHGRKNILLKKNGQAISKDHWAISILNKMQNMNNKLKLGFGNIIEKAIVKVNDPSLTYGSLITEIAKKHGYITTNLNLAKQFKKEAYENRYKLKGYEDLELSTQILIRDAIKRGLNFEIIDRKDNFISLKKENHIEYIKQATKTSKDNYVSVMIMENKIVTKKILKNNNLKVPNGMEINSIEEGINSLNQFINKPIVIKPKSTNFGLGISIFTKGGNSKDLINALEIAFTYDKTVIVEEFIEGKEYRFLVIGEEVVGILHRIPANVLGDGISTITKLVEEKNKNPLRGIGYKTPLEKIKLDSETKLFLKQNNITKEYVPDINEIVYLRENSNISTGGDSIDFTNNIKKEYKEIAIKATKAVNAKICGVDMMIKDIYNEKIEYAIIELNFNPAIHIHCFPYKGIERKIGDKVLDLLEFNENIHC